MSKANLPAKTSLAAPGQPCNSRTAQFVTAKDVLLGVEWVPPELAQSRLPPASKNQPYDKEEQRGCAMLLYEDVSQIYDT